MDGWTDGRSKAMPLDTLASLTRCSAILFASCVLESRHVLSERSYTTSLTRVRTIDGCNACEGLALTKKTKSNASSDIYLKINSQVSRDYNYCKEVLCYNCSNVVLLAPSYIDSKVLGAFSFYCLFLTECSNHLM